MVSPDVYKTNWAQDRSLGNPAKSSIYSLDFQAFQAQAALEFQGKNTLKG